MAMYEEDPGDEVANISLSFVHRGSVKHGSRLRKYVYNTTNINGSFYTQAIYSHDRVTCIINYPQEIRSILVRVSVCEIIYNHMTHGTCRLWTLLMTNITKYNYKLHGIWLVEKTECGIGVRNTESWKTRSLIKIESLGKITRLRTFLTDSVLRTPSFLPCHGIWHARSFPDC